MNVRIDRTRMAMNGNHYAYDGCVLTSEVDATKGEHAGRYTTICRDGQEYYSFSDATRPPEINSMEWGWDRYRAVLAHDEAAMQVLLGLAKSVYPELAPAAKWPTLWVEIPSFDERHAVKYVRLAA